MTIYITPSLTFRARPDGMPVPVKSERCDGFPSSPCSLKATEQDSFIGCACAMLEDDHEQALQHWKDGTVEFEDQSRIITAIMESPTADYKIDSRHNMPCVELKPDAIVEVEIPGVEVVEQLKMVDGSWWDKADIKAVYDHDPVTRTILRLKE